MDQFYVDTSEVWLFAYYTSVLVEILFDSRFPLFDQDSSDEDIVTVAESSSSG